MDHDGFILPKKSLRRSKLIKCNAKIPVSNKFQNLSVNDNVMDTDVNVSNDDVKVLEVVTLKVRSIMANPILKNFNFLKQMHADNEDVNSAGKVSGEFLKIFPKTEEDHRVISRYLDDKKVDHYLITKMILLKSLYADCLLTVDKIKDELVNLGFQVRKVAQMHRLRTRAPMPLFQIQLENIAGSEKIYELKYFMLFFVEVSEYKVSGDVVQCHNCQYSLILIPILSNVNLARAVLNAPAHIELIILLQKGCNCGETGHTANYRGCLKFPKLNKPTVKNPSNLREKPPGLNENVKTDCQVKPGTSYASVLRNDSKATIGKKSDTLVTVKNVIENSDSGPSAFPEIFKLVKEISSIFKNCSISAILQKVVAKLPELKTTENQIDKLFILFNRFEEIFMGSPNHHNDTGTVIYNLVNSMAGLRIATPKTSTRYTAGSTGIIDFFLLRNTSFPLDVAVHDELSSDYYPAVRLLLDISSYTTTDKRAFTTDWRKYVKALNNIQYALPTVQTGNGIDSLVKRFTE
ncbi:hypothetical protein X975_19284, partial [Stegodyphus mimosarum]